MAHFWLCGGKVAGILTACGLIRGDQQAILDAAIFLLCGRRESSGGRHALQERILAGIEYKQLVTNLRTLFQRTAILPRVDALEANRSAA